MAWNFVELLKCYIMPWYNGTYPPSYKNQTLVLRQKAVEIANELLISGAEEGVAIATGLKRARQFLAKGKQTPMAKGRKTKKREP